MSTMLALPESLTPTTKSIATQKRKANNRDVKGLKWFKGSPKKSNVKFRLLKTSQQDSLPQIIPSIAARVVEFDIEGTSERLGVTEQLPIVEKGTFIAEHIIKSNSDFVNQVSSMNHILIERKSKVKGDRVKVKSKRNGKVQPNPSLDVASNVRSKNCGDTETNQPSLPTTLPEPSVRILTDAADLELFDRPNSYIRYIETAQDDLSDDVEYDLEEEDFKWLELINEQRKKQSLVTIKRRDMELMMDRLEKESYFQMQSTGMDHSPPIDDDAVCCICMDGECQNSNAILFCDMCNLAVHQDCYGVPYIPEGQWLCRKCLHSPSRAVECVLCPNRGGALKGTDDGRWAHVACAIWIPEVCFANTVFLEPIESIGNIPPARWRLTCFICKQKGIGACIQCYKSSCYTAFHVTCAQQANLVMKMETVREMHMTSVIIKKTAYCNNHAPPELLLEKKHKDGNEISSPRQKMKQTRKLLAEKRDAIPVVLIPTIPRNRITEISNSVNFPGKNRFMNRLMSYWKLKRQMRNGVPLLRRLQMASSAPNSTSTELPTNPKNATERKEQFDHYVSWIRIRQDLERARILCEMIRKREKYKRQLIYARVQLAEMEICPMNSFFLNILNEIIARDPQEIFLYPVDIEEVPDYLTMIKEPIDLTSMTEKVNRCEYHSVKEVEEDFNLMINNCLLYNDKDTIYYKTALRLRGIGGTIFRKAKKLFDSVGYDPNSGLHLSADTPESESCKCSNSSICNNNCKNTNSSATVPHIPASFTTYRSGGAGVGSDSDGESDLERTTKETDGIGESDSESETDSSLMSTTSDEEDEDAETPLTSAISSESSSNESSSNSSEDEELEPVVAKTDGVIYSSFK